MMGKAATDYILPWDLMGIALGIFLVELIVFAGIQIFRKYWQKY